MNIPGTLLSPFIPLRHERFDPPVYYARSGLRRVHPRCTLNWPTQSKFNKVARALPFKETRAACKWQEATMPSGRKTLVPIP